MVAYYKDEEDHRSVATHGDIIGDKYKNIAL